MRLGKQENRAARDKMTAHTKIEKVNTRANGRGQGPRQLGQTMA